MRAAVVLVLLVALGCGRREEARRVAAADVKGGIELQSSRREREPPPQSGSEPPSFSLSVIPRFYAAGELFGEPVAEGNQFDAGSLEYVVFEVGWPPAGREYTMSGCVVALLSTGVVRLPREQSRVAAGDARHVGSFGYKVAGLWLPGEYELRCDTEGYEVERRRFRVTGRTSGSAGTTMIPNRSGIEKGSVESLRFMEQAYDPPPIGQRSYYGSFRGARYIGAEVKLKLQPLPSPRRFRFRCHWFTDRGQPIGSDARDLEIPPGETDYYMWLSWGNREGTFWRPGTYAVECDADGVLIAAGFFTIL